jgi:thiol-disulfide isomerase/thioredoxin
MKFKDLTSRPSASRAAICLCAVTALIAAACGGGGTTTSGEKPVEQALQEPVSLGPPDGTNENVIASLLINPEPVQPFTLTTLDGQKLSSTDWRGKVVLINFWATWCAPCRAEIPDLIALQEKYRNQLLIVGISEDDVAPEAVKLFAEDQKMNYPIVMLTREIEKTFPGVVSLPTTFMLDQDGRIAKKQVGQLNLLQAEAVTRSLAGLSVMAKIERVEDPGKLSAESAAQVKAIPGIDLASIPAERRTAVLLALNDEKCTCGCDMSVAKCRIEDPSCPFSLPMAKTIAANIGKTQ